MGMGSAARRGGSVLFRFLLLRGEGTDLALEFLDEPAQLAHLLLQLADGPLESGAASSSLCRR